MIIDNLRLTLFIFVGAILEVIINNTTILYIDILGIILVIILVNEIYTIGSLIFISLVADLIGHWYLGSHLLSLVLISFTTSRFINFYKMCNSIQKNFITILYYSISVCFLVAIGAITRTMHFSLISYLLEVIFLLPIILWLFNKIIIKTTMDIIN